MCIDAYNMLKRLMLYNIGALPHFQCIRIDLIRNSLTIQKSNYVVLLHTDSCARILLSRNVCHAAFDEACRENTYIHKHIFPRLIFADFSCDANERKLCFRLKYCSACSFQNTLHEKRCNQLYSDLHKMIRYFCRAQICGVLASMYQFRCSISDFISNIKFVHSFFTHLTLCLRSCCVFTNYSRVALMGFAKCDDALKMEL